MKSTESIHIATYMQHNNVSFGTSGARGLVQDMNDKVCFTYTLAFIQYLQTAKQLQPNTAIAIAGDYRPSSPRIMAAIAMAIEHAGYTPIYCGFIPTPALAFYAIGKSIPCIMVTGSHIPDDRNGMKFYLPEGEVLKSDEQGMCAQTVAVPIEMFDTKGYASNTYTLPPQDNTAYQSYIQRYTDFFPNNALQGKHIAIYEHSSVARELLLDVFTSLGANVLRLGHSDVFLPVDTEAMRPEDVALAKGWASEHTLDAIVSADGDGDRPLISDEHGQWLRGDIAGILCAQYLSAQVIATPVSCNSAVEKSALFDDVIRTRIGSPYVIEAMNHALASGKENVVGYEANGGFLTGSDINIQGHTLTSLPTRDAMIVPLAILMLSIEKKVSISELCQILPKRFTYSDRIKNFPTALSQEKLAPLQTPNMQDNLKAAQALLGDVFGDIQSMDYTDGVRITFASGDIVHLRPSGNAPELRCYTEADSEADAKAINQRCMQTLATWLS